MNTRKPQVENLEVKVLNFNPKSISEALHIPEEAVLREFTDGRVISRFSEYWGAKLYNFEKYSNSNHKDTDGAIHTESLGDIGVSIKTLTKAGIRFQNSKNVGSGRKCSPEDLLDAILSAPRILIVDVVEFPKVSFVMLTSQTIGKWVYQKSLGINGLKREKFYELLSQTHNIHYVEQVLAGV